MKPTHLLAAALFTALILACFAAPAAAFSGGSGTQSDPYIVTTPAELQSMQDDLNAHYQLANDIDLSGVTWIPIGSRSAPFTGGFDGNGYSILNFQLSTNTDAGFINVISGSSAYFKNTKFENANLIITTNSVPQYYYSGIICGYLEDGARISTCAIIDSNIDSSLDLGILVGSINYGSVVTDCFILSSSAKSDCRYIGGISAIVDFPSYNEIRRVYVIDCTIQSDTCYRIGGIVGYMSSDTRGSVISDSYTSGDIIYSASSVNAYRILGVKANGVGVDNCYSSMKINNNDISSSNADSLDGATSAISESLFTNTLNWDFSNTWYWDESANLPKLQVFKKSVTPTISSISATPATGGQLTEYTLSVAATTEAAGGITGYQWSYSTDSGTTWQAISGATTATYVWTPGTSISGTALLKCYITGADGGIIDSYEAGYTNIQITVYPPPDISTISVSRPLQKVNTPTTLTATLAESEPATYQWYYSTNGGTTWTPISGATALTAEYTPTTTGTHSVKIIVTNTYGESNELTTNFNVLPTYTPTPITNRSVDISIDSTAKYQGIQQFTLSAELKALNYYTPTLAHLAHDNALYYLDSAELEVIPVSTTTGGTISAAYIGQYTGIITDTAGNTALYSYQTNDWQYIEQANAQIIASTASYAATVSGGTLRIYNANGNLVASTATAAANLAGNDASNVFVSYSGSTLTYYWVNGNSISSATQTVTNAITELHQISGTSNFIISTAKNTVIAEISDTGVYSLVATSNTDTPLIHTQATSINIFIGVAAPNEIFIIGADGETDGTYKTGSTLSDASIAKSTGLFAIAGGADYQAYILSKSESSVWQLAQVVAFGEAIDYSQISTTGTYAAVSTGLKLYLLEAKDTDTSTYYLQGVVIGSTGKPYAGKTISINGDTIRTDTNGMFLYPVQPGKLLIITAGDTTVEYTPSNAALQQIAIRIKAGLLSTEVTYNAEYSVEAQAIVMSYDDSAGKTTAVNWNVYETANNTLVATYTGNSASFPIAPGDVYNNYYVQLSADRGAATVANTWSITPAGGKPVDLYGLDEDGRNIIFGFLLLLLAGLFGVMHSRSGAILVSFAACIMRYLELITIPWALILIAVVLAIVAAIAHGGQNQ